VDLYERPWLIVFSSIVWQYSCTQVECKFEASSLESFWRQFIWECLPEGRPQSRRHSRRHKAAEAAVDEAAAAEAAAVADETSGIVISRPTLRTDASIVGCRHFASAAWLHML